MPSVTWSGCATYMKMPPAPIISAGIALTIHPAQRMPLDVVPRIGASVVICPSRSAVDRHDLQPERAGVIVRRADDAVVAVLFHDVRGPAGDPGDGEDRREQVQ